MSRPRRRIWLVSATVVVVALGVPIVRRELRVRSEATTTTAPSPASADHEPGLTAAAATASFVGEAVCASCHAREDAVWRGSHHQLAMQPATEATVLGNFHDARFRYAGIQSTLFRRDGKFFAHTDGPDGTLHDYPITHTFGVAPLQQYLVAFPGGRLQALEIAWDSRPRPQGGQRWFHLYPQEHVVSGDPLHWTGPTENWNFMCADCHSTNVRKAYDATAAQYATRSTEVAVACEACHGAGSRHVAWANKAGDWRRDNEDKGLQIALDERHGVAWTRSASSGQPERSIARKSEREIEMCARCHSRRGLIHEDQVHGQPLGDDYHVALLDEELYHHDGQVKGEVYEYGSFIQSRMYAAGVTCSDCHDPHRPELRASSDGVCLQCHAEQRYFTSKHHFHAAGTPAARCVSCHMAATAFMVVDPRRDHSLRIPRPDLSVKLGVPNACNGCHTDRPAKWAALTVERWYGHTPSGFQQFAETLAAGATGAPGAQTRLAALANDRRQPAIARATAVARMDHRWTEATLGALQAALADTDALVRRAAVQAAADLDPRARAPLLSPLLADRVRVVRIEAAAAMASVPPELIADGDRPALKSAIADFVAAQELNADRPEGHLDLALLYAGQKEPERAEAELKRALAIDPGFVPAAVNLADLYRTIGRDGDAEPVLRQALVHARDNPSLLYALGLVMVREKRPTEALSALGAAARLGSGNPRYGYVHAVALHDLGQKRAALERLEAVAKLHPYDRDTLAALINFWREAGEPEQAAKYAQQLEQLAGR